MARVIAVLAVMLMCVVTVSAARQAPPGRLLADFTFDPAEPVASAPVAVAPAPEVPPVSSPVDSRPAWAPVWESASPPVPADTPVSAPTPVYASPPDPADTPVSAPPSVPAETPVSASPPVRGY